MPDAAYFLGTVLLMDQPGIVTDKLSPKMSAREFDVVDGQQRLVTLMTLFAVLRDLEGDTRGPIHKRVQSMLVAQQGGRFFRTERFRLHLSNRDRTVFEENILRPASTMAAAETIYGSESEDYLIAVRAHFLSALSATSANARRVLADFIADKCFVVIMVSHDIDRAHRMFTVLNDRGRQLQHNDILKTDVLGGMPPSTREWAQTTWDDISLSLGDNFEIFFSHLRTIYGENRPEVVTGVREVIRACGGAASFFEDVFLPLGKAYALIKNGGQSVLPPDIVRRLVYLNRLSDADWAPAAMLAIKDWERDPDRAVFLIAEIDRFAHAMRLHCSGTGRRVRRFSAFVRALRTAEKIDLSHPCLVVTRDEEKNIAHHLLDFQKRNAKGCKAVLLRLGDEMSGTLTLVDPERYTIEHILPQRCGAGSTWQQWFPDNQRRGIYVESLGNLVLISSKGNRRANNFSWEEKKEIYAKDTEATPLLAITREVLSESEWQPAQIEAREQRFFNLIEQIWRLDVRSNKSASLRDQPETSQGRPRRRRSA